MGGPCPIGQSSTWGPRAFGPFPARRPVSRSLLVWCPPRADESHEAGLVCVVCIHSTDVIATVYRTRESGVMTVTKKPLPRNGHEMRGSRRAARDRRVLCCILDMLHHHCRQPFLRRKLFLLARPSRCSWSHRQFLRRREILCRLPSCCLQCCCHLGTGGT